MNAFVAKHEVAWDITMAVLALAYILAGLFEDHPHGILNLRTLIPIELAISLPLVVAFAPMPSIDQINANLKGGGNGEPTAAISGEALTAIV